MKILLTSAGFENKNIEKTFLNLIGKKGEDIRAIFVPTAAIDAGAISVLPKCMNDLLNAGILNENIFVYDLHHKLTLSEIETYDTIYFCGGNTEYLLERILEIRFDLLLKRYLNNGGTYVGVSAGSIIATQSLPNNLGYINCTLSVHCQDGIKAGILNTINCPHISLTNNQAILITDEGTQVIE